MGAELVDSSPYSRLIAFQRMDIVEHYERIRDFSVAVVTILSNPMSGPSEQLCLQGISGDAVSGHIKLLIPG
ncbi:hypothetical protein V6N13_036020 [Hibiscus sabdariffa]|uniref:Uncharacterized protein n=1 Tax=Hibiscus sabdariffa TaxID=183260 RepID=A0ABR2S7N8_9ROSI